MILRYVIELDVDEASFVQRYPGESQDQIPGFIDAVIGYGMSMAINAHDLVIMQVNSIEPAS